MLNNLYIKILRFFGIYKKSNVECGEPYQPHGEEGGWSYPIKLSTTSYYFFGIKYKTKKY